MQDIRSKVDYSSLFATFSDSLLLFALFETIRTIHDYLLFATIVWFQKISKPQPGRNWKFRRGGGSKTQEIPEGRGIV